MPGAPASSYKHASGDSVSTNCPCLGDRHDGDRPGRVHPSGGGAAGADSHADRVPPPHPPPSGPVPPFGPSLAAIQMIGPRLGWAAGSHAIYVTTDGTHWTKQYAS